ncbi:hypothetical protein EJB05_31815 [Eragrostis curvula]|uniref:RING-type E3 ubiquitin transferase n=1 Tax=Eragrostis curvula TaxID=38414 RepID=A0A5J9UEJ3_9POAL|nr:hypothetical protein EJB05_31815 [Eragrostis curvula]
MSNISTKKRKGEPQREMEEEGSSSVFFDLEVLNCPICFDPLAPPIYQCLVGHFTCSSCYKKLPAMKKCHHCSRISSIYHRCYGIEKVIESIQIPCSNTEYGCTVKTSYHQKEDHKGECPHAPCFCPETGCNIAGSTEMLMDHFTTEHHWPFTEFKYGRLFHAKIQDGVRVLSCEDGRLFLLNVSPEQSGSGISVYCVQPHDVEPKFRCDLQLNLRKERSGHSQTSDFLVPSTNLSDGIPRNHFQCIVPKSYLEKDSKIRLTVNKA